MIRGREKCGQYQIGGKIMGDDDWWRCGDNCACGSVCGYVVAISGRGRA